jgi:hypothetical protein
MDLLIHTSDPESIDVAEIRSALEALDYFVGEITVIDRGL